MAKPLLKGTTNADIISYFINQNPELATEIDLPVQGKSVKPYGALIMDNQRYKNAFINTFNVLALTIIDENRWENPWKMMTDKGSIEFGQQIREMIMDIAHVNDYNKNYENKTKFLEAEVPDVYQYIHEINFQKFYDTKINENEMRLAFQNEDSGLYDLLVKITENLYTSFEYDKYLVDKYQLCRRFLNGTVKSIHIDNNLEPRDLLAKMKGVSNLMEFMSPNYNPAGVRRATKLNNQYLLLDATRTAVNETNVFATSFFLDEAKQKTGLQMIDSFAETDEERLALLLEDAYVPFTSAEKESLSHILGAVISDDFFFDKYYALDGNRDGKTIREFENPTTLERNIFLHVWAVISTSPFAQAVVFTYGTPAVTKVEVSPMEVSISAGNDLQLSAKVTTSGLANKSVFWHVEEAGGETEANPVTVDIHGKVHIPSDYDTSEENPIIVRATSVFDNTKYDEASITVL